MSDDDRDVIVDELVRIDESNIPPKEKELAIAALVSIQRWRVVNSCIQGFLWASVIVAITYFRECSC